MLAAIHKKIAGFHRDELYIGTAEERAAKELADDDDISLVGSVGHPRKLPVFADNAPSALAQLLAEDKHVEVYVPDQLELEETDTDV